MKGSYDVVLFADEVGLFVQHPFPSWDDYFRKHLRSVHFFIEGMLVHNKRIFLPLMYALGMNEEIGIISIFISWKKG